MDEKMDLPAVDFKTLFESVPGLYLILTPELHVVAASNTYLTATSKERTAIVGRHLFDVFPDNPDVPSDAIVNTRASLTKVLESGQTDVMAVQRHDIQEVEGGAWVEKYWSPINSPVFNERGEIIFIVHRVEDVTEFIRFAHLRAVESRKTDELKRHADEMESEVFLRAQQVQRANALLRDANEELTKREAALRTITERLDLILHSIAEGVIVADTEGKFVLWNPAAERLIGMGPQDISVSGHSQEYGLFLPDQATAFPTERLPLVRAIRGESVDAQEVFLRRPDRPEGAWFSVSGRPLISHDGQLMGGVVIFSDISESKRIYAELQYLSVHDELTGIANRRMFDERLAREWRRACRERVSLGLLMVDVDFFKALNDVHGHQKGDECLRKVSQSLSGVVGRPTDLVARYGGDEIAVLLPGAGTEGALNIGERLRSAVRELAFPHQASKADRIVTVSVGVAAVVPSREGRPDSLIRAADQALYRAKFGGRNRVEAAFSF